MKTTFHKNLKAFTLCAGFFSLVACKEKSTVKPDLIPDVDGINTFEANNMAMSVKNTYFDSLQTNDYDYPVVGIGRIANDAFFGKTTAGAYMQFIPPSENFTFPTGTIMDSAVLSLPYLNFSYADTNRTIPTHALNLKAYEITDNFAYGDTSVSKYYTFSKIGYNTTPVGSGIVTLKSIMDTTVLSNGDTITRLLRLRVDGLKEKFKNMSAANLATPSAFLANFKGIYLGPDTSQTQNTLSYFAVSNGSTLVKYTNAQLEFYYHTATDTTRKASYFRFNAANCAFFNGIYKNYTGFPASNYLVNQTANRDSLVIQGYPGFHSEVTIQLDTVNLRGTVINKAALTITVLKTGDDGRFNAPPQLQIRAIDADGTVRPVADALNNDGTPNTSGTSFVGGVVTNYTAPGGTTYLQYTLNIPRELQKALSEGKTGIKLRLVAPTAYLGSFRMIADGPNSSNVDTRLKFNVIYTKLK